MKRIFYLAAFVMFIMFIHNNASATSIDVLNDWTRCNATLNMAGTESDNKSRYPQARCFEMNEDQTDSIIIDVSSPYAKICLRTDTQSAAIGAIRATLHDCNRGLPPTATSCSQNLINTYDTDECFAVTHGVYLFIITTPVAVDEAAVLYVQSYE